MEAFVWIFFFGGKSNVRRDVASCPRLLPFPSLSQSGRVQLIGSFSADWLRVTRGVEPVSTLKLHKDHDEEEEEDDSS